MWAFNKTFFQQLPKPLRLLLLLVTVNTHSLISLYCANFLHVQAICLLETFSFSLLLLTSLWRKSITLQLHFIPIISKYFLPLSFFFFLAQMDKKRNLWSFCIYLAFSVCWLALKLRTLPFMHLLYVWFIPASASP